jgi:hypothetical protein
MTSSRSVFRNRIAGGDHNRAGRETDLHNDDAEYYEY